MKTIHRLTPQLVKSLNQPRRYADGAGLYLHVAQRLDGGVKKSWVYRFVIDKKTFTMGLGPIERVDLDEARRKAADLRNQRAAGLNPLDEKRAAQANAKMRHASRMTFEEAYPQVIKRRKFVGGPEGKQANEWRRMFENYAKSIAKLNVADITTEHVLAMLKPIWTTKNPTAETLRMRTEIVLDWWAATNTLIDYQNPARYRKHLERVLPHYEHKTTNRPSIDWRQMQACWTKLDAMHETQAAMFRFLVLTGTRDKEARLVTWSEIDLDAAKWTIPAERQNKTGIMHEVPLSRQSLAILKSTPSFKSGHTAPTDLVFTNVHGRHFHNSDMTDVLRAAGYAASEASTHGMRASLETWLGENTTAPHDVREACIAHDKRTAIVRAYQRTRFYDARIALMQAWADYLTQHGQAAKVSPLRRRKSAA